MARLITAVCLAASVLPSWGVVPLRINYQARLTDPNGVPLTPGGRTLFLTIFRGGSSLEVGSGTKVYSEQATVAVSAGGVVSYGVGGGTPQPIGGSTPTLGPATFKGGSPGESYFLEVAVDASGNVITPRVELQSVPFALTTADSGAPTDARQAISELPFTITSPGSYYLTQDLTLPTTATASTNGISVDASGVTIDLNGFLLLGQATSDTGSGTGAGIRSLSGANGIRVLNGWVASWAGSGIELSQASAARVEDVSVSDNGTTGIATGPYSVVARCAAIGNGQAGGEALGIVAGTNSLVTACTARGNVAGGSNTAVGIRAADGSEVSGCTSSGQRAAGSGSGIGIQAGASSTVSDSSALDNKGGSRNGAGYGIQVGNGCLAFRCTASGNSGQTNATGAGIFVSDECVVAESQCRQNTGGFVAEGFGILGGNSCSFRGNVCSGNKGGSSSGSGYGISAGSMCRFELNTVTGNAPNSVQGNAFGIRAGNDCVITQNEVSANLGSTVGGSFGISASNRNRIEGNHCTQHAAGLNGGYGIRITGSTATGNVLLANTTSQNGSAGITLENVTGKNYVARNIMDEGSISENLPGQNVQGTLGEANVSF